MVDAFEALFIQAIQRTLWSDSVGLYLSGGIDSALIGTYLREAGVRVNAYTSAPWGPKSSEIPFAEANARLIGAQDHTVDHLGSSQYGALMDRMPALFGGPHGTTTAIGVASLWTNTALGTEKQIYFGQNSDTIIGCVPSQSLVYFVHFLPTFLHRRLHPRIKDADIVANYLSFTHEYEGEPSNFAIPAVPANYSALQRLIHWGIYAAHTASDAEVLAQPAVRQHIKVSDPFFDVDLVEFLLGLPLRHRIALSRQSKIGLVIEKRLTQSLALRYFSADIVRRKKAFTVSLERDEQTQSLMHMLPHEMNGMALKNINERFAAKTLQDWANLTGVTVTVNNQ